MRARQAARAASIAAGDEPTLAIRLVRPIDPFDAWVWFRSSKPFSPDDVDLLDGVWTAWHLLGRLGAFNGSNLQLFHGDGIATEHYDAYKLETAASTLFHDAGEVEAGPGGGGGGGAPLPPTALWALDWVNMGTTDELALDVLANALGMLAKECVSRFWFLVFFFFPRGGGGGQKAALTPSHHPSPSSSPHPTGTCP